MLSFIKTRLKNERLVAYVEILLGCVIVNLFEPFLWLYFSAMGCMFCLLAGLLAAVDRGDVEPAGRRRSD